MQELSTIKEVAEYLKLSRPQVYRIMKSGQLKAINIGMGDKSIWRITRTELERFMKGGE